MEADQQSFFFCPYFLQLIPYHLVLSQEIDLNHYLGRDAGGGLYQKDHNYVEVLIYLHKDLMGFVSVAKFYLHISPQRQHLYLCSMISF